MRKTILLVALLPTLAWAQNPVSDAIRSALPGRSKNIIAAAEDVPADKYAYKPTPEQRPFGGWVFHTAEANYTFCGKLAGADAPELTVKETDPKEKLVPALKQSFDFCSRQLPKLQDSKLGEEITLGKDRKITKAALVLILGGSWSDHYGQMATYMRLNGLLPPTAKK